MLNLIRSEAEKRGEKAGTNILDVERVEELVDTNIITKIDEYKKVNEKLVAECRDTNRLAKMNPLQHEIQKGFKGMMRDSVNHSLKKQMTIAQMNFRS